MTPANPDALADAPYVLLKRGLFERPGHHGYTGVLRHAGRFSHEEASSSAVHGGSVTMMLASEAPVYSPACWHETQVEDLLDLLRIEREAKAAAEARAAQLQAEVEAKDRARWLPIATAPTDRPVVVRMKTDRLPGGWFVATATLPDPDDVSRAGSCSTIWHYNGEILQGGFRGTWTDWLDDSGPDRTALAARAATAREGRAMLALFGLKLHWGDPKHPTELRSWTGALGSNDRPWQHCYVSHEIGRWFGISHKRNWFVGAMLTTRTDESRTTERPRFGRGVEIGERPSDIPMAYEKMSAPNPHTPASGALKIEEADRGLR